MPETPPEATGLPKHGRSREWIESELDRIQASDLDPAHMRLLTGIHKPDDETEAVCRSAYGRYFHSNGITADWEPGLGRMQREVLSFTVSLLGGATAGRANITSGGSESIFCAMHAAREWASANGRAEGGPVEIILPRTGHAAFDKAAHYLGMRVVRVPVGADYRADPAAMAEAVTPRTAVIVCSAPCWGLGLLDPIAAVADIARDHGLWMHVDACVGGFLLPFMERLGVELAPFDFRVPQVCSISADIHKHGYSAKPCSTVSYRDESLQAFHYAGVAIDDWQSGTYKTHGLVGSRPGGAVAAAWAVMNFLGEEGYLRLTRRALDVKDRLVAGIESIDDFWCLRNESLLVPFRSESLDMLRVFGGLVERGYFPWGTFDPVFCHPSGEPVDDLPVDMFLEDLAAIAAGVRDGSITEQALAKYIG